VWGVRVKEHTTVVNNNFIRILLSKAIIHGAQCGLSGCRNCTTDVDMKHCYL
jgi:hypothetical protein